MHPTNIQLDNRTACNDARPCPARQPASSQPAMPASQAASSIIAREASERANGMEQQVLASCSFSSSCGKVQAR